MRTGIIWDRFHRSDGLFFKEDGDDKKNIQMTQKNQLDRRVVKLVMLACPGGVVLGYV